MASAPPGRKALIVKAVFKSLIKSLSLTALVMAPGLGLLVTGHATFGMIALLLASFWLMARSYKRPWCLTTFSCFSPPLVALASYLLQLWLFAEAGLPAGTLAIAVGLGVFVGWWRGRSHRVYREDGALFARRTFGYLLSWVLAYGFTQALAMTATSVLLIRAGLLTGAFTTTLLVMVSVMLVRQRRAVPPAVVANVAGILFAAVFLTATVLVSTPAWTQSPGLQNLDDPVVQELQAAIDRGNAADLFGAALATGLNDELGLLDLQRVVKDPSEPDTEEFAGFRSSAAQFRGITTEDELEITFFVGEGLNARARLLIDMFGPTLLDKAHAWILSPDRRDKDGEVFHGTIERVGVGDYGLLIYGPGDGDGNAIGIFLSGGRAVMASFESKGQEGRTQAMVQMTMATLRYLEQMYTAGPGTFTAAAGKTNATTAATLVMLTSAGIAVSLAQAIAAALGQSVQVATDTASQAVTEALADPPGPEETLLGDGNEDGSSTVPPPPTPPPPTPPGPDYYDKEGNPFDRNEEGEYWSPDDKGDWRWQNEHEARLAEEALSKERSAREAEIVHHQRETERMLAESRRKINAKNRAEEEALRQRQQAESLAQKLAADRKRRVTELLRKRAKTADKAFRGEVEKLVGQDNEAGLEDLLKDRLAKEVTEGQSEAATAEAWATAWSAGEGLSRATVAGAKAALMAVGGPAGVGVTGLAVGSVSAAESGAESAVRGDGLGEFAKKTVTGFATGFKDGATSVYTNLPGTGRVVKVLVPAGADAAETYVRTGDGRQALVSAVASMAGDALGGGADGINNAVGRELSGAAVTVGVAEATNYANGGQLGDAYEGALINHLGGKVGGHLGHWKGTQAAGQAADQAGGLAASRTPDADPEKRVRAALEEAHAGSREIPLAEQSSIVQKLDGTRHREVLLDANGQPRVDANGDPVTGEFVNARGALAQLQDTRSSRTAKSAPDGLREALIATRRDKIYGPADEATINKVTPILQKEGLLRPGDTVEMDTFSTPGAKPSLGADRDARLVIKRPLGADANGNPREGFERIEVDRKHWERIALKDFHDHTTALAREGGHEITPETQPEFFRRREELGWMRRPDTPEAIAKLQAQGYSQAQIAKLQQQGLTQEQIDHQAWAEAHNQLFTDRHHMEASRDNADQAFREVNGRLEQSQERPNILGTQAGESKLKDAEGFGRMWAEKSTFYRHNQPEALAQSQKGIAALMKVREGYRAQDLEPPPLTEQTASAMEIVLKAPVGADATPEAMARVESDLQGLGYHDMNDALRKIAQQQELMKWSTHSGAAGQVTELGGGATAQVRELGTSDVTRAALGSNSHLWEDLNNKE